MPRRPTPATQPPGVADSPPADIPPTDAPGVVTPETPAARQGRARAATAGAAPADGAKRGPGRPSNDDRLEASLTEQYEELAELLALVLPNTAIAMADRAPRMARAWVAMSRTRPKWRARLESGVEGAGWIAVAIAHAPLGKAVVADLALMRGGGEGLEPGSPAPAPPAAAGTDPTNGDYVGPVGNPLDMARLLADDPQFQDRAAQLFGLPSLREPAPAAEGGGGE